MSERPYYSIGEVLGLLLEEFPDVSISKIRFLEGQGLIDPERTPSGYRKFYDRDLDRLRWILREQRENYLPLKVIKERLEGTDGTPAAPTRPIPIGASWARLPEGDEPIGDETMAYLLEASGGDDTSAEGLVAGALATESAEPDRGASTASPHGRPSPQPTKAVVEPDPTLGLSRAGIEAVRETAASRSSQVPPAASDGATSAAVRTDPVGSGVSGGTSAPVGDPVAPGRSGVGGATPAGRPAVDAARPVPSPSAQADDQPVRRVDLDGNAAAVDAPSVSVAPQAAPVPAAPNPAQAAAETARTEPPHTEAARIEAARIEAARTEPRTEAARTDGARAAGERPGGAAADVDAARQVNADIDGATLEAGEIALELTAAELCAKAGISTALLQQLQEYGLVEPSSGGNQPVFGFDALKVATAAGRLAAQGLEARHLRTWKVSADREATLFEQLLQPLVRQRNPASRRQAAELTGELSRAGADLRAALMRVALKPYQG